ncbi:MAG: hypothetical protein J3K34DRAFT_520626 [Monoraphidium minutum]|nr:MAG: hypothetical protein J3K34DRAFT_520626 [Monoraphidium minutum]
MAAAHLAQVVAVSKPPGLSFHTDAEGNLGLVARLRALLAGQAQSGGGGGADGWAAAGWGGAPPPERLWPVHRLDSVTSGIVLFATSPHAAGLLSRAFREKQVVKYYVALSGRRPSKSQGSVVGDMERGRAAGWRLTRGRSDPSVTRFVSAGLPALRPGVRAFLLRPETGRTHQLRVALKSLGSPVLGDPLYAAVGDAASEARAYLHAAALRLRLEDGALLQVVDAPRDGELFAAAPFQELFASWFPPGAAGDEGPWLSRWPLLASDGRHTVRRNGSLGGGVPNSPKRYGVAAASPPSPKAPRVRSPPILSPEARRIAALFAKYLEAGKPVTTLANATSGAYACETLKTCSERGEPVHAAACTAIIDHKAISCVAEAATPDYAKMSAVVGVLSKAFGAGAVAKGMGNIWGKAFKDNDNLKRGKPTAVAKAYIGANKPAERLAYVERVAAEAVATLARQRCPPLSKEALADLERAGALGGGSGGGGRRLSPLLAPRQRDVAPGGSGGGGGSSGMATRQSVERSSADQYLAGRRSSSSRNYREKVGSPPWPRRGALFDMPDDDLEHAAPAEGREGAQGPPPQQQQQHAASGDAGQARGGARAQGGGPLPPLPAALAAEEQGGGVLPQPPAAPAAAAPAAAGEQGGGTAALGGGAAAPDGAAAIDARRWSIQVNGDCQGAIAVRKTLGNQRLAAIASWEEVREPLLSMDAYFGEQQLDLKLSFERIPLDTSSKETVMDGLRLYMPAAGGDAFPASYSALRGAGIVLKPGYGGMLLIRFKPGADVHLWRASLQLLGEPGDAAQMAGQSVELSAAGAAKRLAAKVMATLHADTEGKAGAPSFWRAVKELNAQPHLAGQATLLSAALAGFNKITI